jgi:hypothetical protein
MDRACATSSPALPTFAPLIKLPLLIKLVRERGNRLRKPRSAPLGGGLFELRGEQVRIFYMFRPGHRIVLLDGMVKKRNDIPHEVLERVRQLQKEVR